MNSVLLLVSMSNLFLNQFIIILEWFFVYQIKNLENFHRFVIHFVCCFYFCFCLPFYLFFSEEFDISIEFLKAETLVTFLHFIVFSLKLLDKGKNYLNFSGFELSLDLYKLLFGAK